MTLENLKQLEPLADWLATTHRNRSVGNGQGNILWALLPIYQSELHPGPVNMHCGACQMQMIDELFNEFEKNKYLLVEIKVTISSDIKDSEFIDKGMPKKRTYTKREKE